MSTLTEIANKLIEKTNCTTAEAIEALDKANGDYDKALEIINSNKNKSNIKITYESNDDTGKTEEQSRQEENKQEESKKSWTEQFKVNSKDILKVIKALLKEGNVTRITVKQKGSVVLNFPVNIAAIGAILAPYLAAIGAIAAVATDCTIEVEREGDVVVNVSDKLKKASEKIEKTVKDILDKED